MSVHALPHTVEEITPAWLTSALSERFPGARVSAAEMTQFIDGTAQKCRFALTYESAEAGGPSSVWVKGGFDPKGASQGDAFANETRFFKDIAPLVDMLLPDAFFGGIDDATNNGVLVLEDLILSDATFGRATEPLDAEMAKRVLSQQARLHARFWGGRDLEGLEWVKPGGSIAAAGVVDQYFGLWDTASGLERFKFLTDEQRERERVQAAMNALMRDMIEQPRCVVHGDSQGGNLFFIGDQPGYLDWQHCMRGNWAFDVSGFMMTALTVETRRKHQKDLLRHYLGELAAHGADAPGFDEAWNDYSRYALWAFMWVMCPVEAHPEEICCLNTERACAAIEELGTLQKLGV